jgi:RNA 3'-terminal phosphate cyclase (RTC), insert domain
MFVGVRIDIEAYKESPHAAFGNGSGIVIVARTSTGCILGTGTVCSIDSDASRVAPNNGTAMARYLSQIEKVTLIFKHKAKHFLANMTEICSGTVPYELRYFFLIF